MRKLLFVFAVVSAIFVIGCRAYNKPTIVSIQSNETAFLVDMRGDTDTVQSETLRKVDAKNVEIAGYWIQTGRFYFDGKYYPLSKVFVVSRLPVKLYWGDEDSTDTSIPKVRVTSSDNVGFVVPTVINAYIEDEDAATYLKFFRPKNDSDDPCNVRLESRPLESVLNDIVYPYINDELKRLFIEKPAIDAERNANAFIKEIEPKVKQYAKQYGITVLSLAGLNGIIFDNPVFQQALEEVALAEIQREGITRNETNRAISRQTELEDARNQAEMSRLKSSTIEVDKTRQEIDNSRILAEAQARAIEAFARNAQLPAVLPESTFMSLGLDKLIPTK